ncbi:hypothetical protein ACA086_11400 [Muriicola sp. E247]|uniref:HYC_CC_PP family protein n=1 Tax=Muriicola sp. E247 TaxID=3242730 RepID=UPI003525C287
MDSRRHKIGALTLAFMVLFSTMSFSMDMHFCGDSLVDFKLFQQADDCGMAMDGATSDDMMGAENHCCSDVEVVVSGQDDLHSIASDISFEQQNLIISFLLVCTHFFNEVDKQSIPFKEYSPPLLIRDVQLMDQTFLI